MPKTKRARASAKPQKRFSLVPTQAQYAMYEALRKLNRKRANHNGAEVAEIATCLAAGEASPVVFACDARGARAVGRLGKTIRAKQTRLASATVAAVDQLVQSATGTNAKNSSPTIAIVCAGALESHSESQQDYRAAFAFAARHKLPILFVIANALKPGKGGSLDLRSLYPEFGMPVFTVDAADAIAAYRVATEALHQARHHRGPCVIEALTIGDQAATPLELLAAYMERHGNPPK